MTKKQDRVYCPRCTCSHCQTERSEKLNGWPSLGLADVFPEGTEVDGRSAEFAVALRKLFRRYGIAPLDIEDAHRESAEGSQESEIEVQEIIAKARARAERPNDETESERSWRPSGLGDWIELAIRQAIFHREPGFHLAPIGSTDKVTGAADENSTIPDRFGPFDNAGVMQRYKRRRDRRITPLRNGGSLRDEVYQLVGASEKWSIDMLIKRGLEQGKTKTKAAEDAVNEIKEDKAFQPGTKRSIGVVRRGKKEEMTEFQPESARKRYTEPPLLPPVWAVNRYYDELFEGMLQFAADMTVTMSQSETAVVDVCEDLLPKAQVIAVHRLEIDDKYGTLMLTGNDAEGDPILRRAARVLYPGEFFEIEDAAPLQRLLGAGAVRKATEVEIAFRQRDDYKPVHDILAQVPPYKKGEQEGGLDAAQQNKRKELLKAAREVARRLCAEHRYRAALILKQKTTETVGKT